MRERAGGGGETHLRCLHGSVRLVWCYLSDLLANQALILEKTSEKTAKVSYWTEEREKYESCFV